MIDPSFDNTPVTMTEYLTVESLGTKVDQLNNSLDSMTADRDFWRGKALGYSDKIASLEEYIKDNFDYIDEDVSQSIVDIFGLSITKEYDVTVTVTFSGTVSAPLNYDMDSLDSDLSASLDVSSYGDVESDFMEDKMEIDWTES